MADLDVLDQVQTAGIFERQIDDGRVGSVAAHDLQGLVRAGGLADHLELALAV